MITRFAAFASVALFLSAFSARSIVAQDMGISVGQRAPSGIVVQSLDGRAVNLDRYVGKGPVLLEFWATWCPSCRELMPALLGAEKKYGSRVKFIAVAVSVNQSPERVRRFLASHPLPHETLFDVSGKAAEAFDAPATSYVVVVDARGKVVYTGLGGRQDLVSAIKRAFR